MTPSRAGWRRLAGPGLATLAMLAVLLGLGTWQVRRMRWKHRLLAEIALAESKPAVPPVPGLPPFAKVRVAGALLADCATYGIEGRDLPAGSMLGTQLIQPLARANQPTILVDRGWVARDASAVPCVAEPAEIEGYLRPPARPGWFTPADSPARRQFYTLDPVAIGAALGQPAAPFVLVALGPATDQQPIPAQHLPRPPDNHLDYALTWYGLAAVLATIFILWARKQRRA